MVGFGLALSAAAIWFITDDITAVLAYVAALAALAVLAFVVVRKRAKPVGDQVSLPDWSVTVAAIERHDAAVAISDRAGRLVCANALYRDWFGARNAPLRLDLGDASLERLSDAAREAWRDGEARIDGIEGKGPGTKRWRAVIERAGRAGDYQVWRFEPIEAADPVGELVVQLDGKIGRALAKSGIAVALVDSDGTIRGASPGFAQGATGDAAADVAGARVRCLPEPA